MKVTKIQKEEQDRLDLLKNKRKADEIVPEPINYLDLVNSNLQLE